MNIAVIFTKDATEGGAFQYALSMSLLLKKNISSKYNFTFFTTVKKNPALLKKYGLSAVYLPWSNFDRCRSLFLGSQLVANMFAKMGKVLELKHDRILKKHNIDLVYFLSPSDLAVALNCHNYIFTVLDLCFLDSMEFPEVYLNREFERREKLYRIAVTKAVSVITDSEFTNKNLLKKYGINEERIIILPFLPSNAVIDSQLSHGQDFIDIKKRYNIRSDYIFYPAQFWPHKNHIYILDGLKLLKEKYKMKMDAVFCGSDKGSLPYIRRKTREFGVEDQIHYIGYVSDEELPYLYKQAMAVVMPTYFVPTNIPPLEAFTVGCPVLYSDLSGLREEVKDAALLLDLKDPESLCRELLKIINRSPEIDTIIKNGKRKIESLMKVDYWTRLKNIFDSYEIRLRCWK